MDHSTTARASRPGTSLAVTRVPVSNRSFRFAFRRASGRLEVNLAHARFITDAKGKSWRPATAPTAVTMLDSRFPGMTALRVACGDDVAQFIVDMPRVDVLMFLATSVPEPIVRLVRERPG